MNKLFTTADVPPKIIVSMSPAEWQAIRGTDTENVLDDVVGKARGWPARKILYRAVERGRINGSLASLKDVRDGNITLQGFDEAAINVLTSLISDYEAQ